MSAGSSGSGTAGAGPSGSAVSGVTSGGRCASGPSAATRSSAATSTRGSASASRRSTSAAVQRRFTGTAAAPATAAASSVSAQANEFGRRSATRSPGWTPAATSIRARASTRAASSAPLRAAPLASSTSTGPPSRLRVRTRSASVSTAGDRSGAAAAPATRCLSRAPSLVFPAMQGPTAEQVRAALPGGLVPNFRRDIVTLGMVGEDVAIEGGTVRLHVRPGTEKPEVLDQLGHAIDRAVRALPGVSRVDVHFAGAAEGRGRDPFAARAALPDVAHIVAVASTKGGVGKSTVAANLALALAAQGRRRVGLLDADVYGPSLPIMFGTDARPRVSAAKRIQPIEREGIALISMGFFLDEQSPVIWRGPIVMGIVRQFLRDVDWGALDFLVVDLPPGTGDAQLTLVQQVPVSGAVVVTTPQDVALLDVGRGIAMFAQVSTPVLGIVENMSGYACPKCGTVDPVFGEGGAQRLAEHFGLPLLARIPLVAAIREGGDRGEPIVVAEPNHPASRIFHELAERVAAAAVRSAEASAAAVLG